MPEKVFQRKANIVQLDFLQTAERRARLSQKASAQLRELNQKIRASQARINELEKRPRVIRSSQDVTEFREMIEELNAELMALQNRQKAIFRRVETFKKRGF